MNYVYFFLGLTLLALGADLLVRGASRLAFFLKISPLVVGLTVVAYGTSTPELSVNIVSALNNKVDIALGNIVGSNICNVFLILGFCALVKPIHVHQKIVRFDVPLMIGASILLMILGLDHKLGKLDGTILFLSVILYTVFIIWESRREQQTTTQESVEGSERPSNKKSLPLAILQVLMGLGLLILGSRWLVQAAVFFAQKMGVSELIIGLTVVAVGTSLPEIMTSVIATAKGNSDIAAGNVVGSNIYNILAILGLSALMAKDGIPVSEAALGFDIPVMVGAALACLPIFFTGHKISRWEGLLFLGYYVAYTAFLILDSQKHDLQTEFSQLMLSFILPLTAITIMIFFFRSLSKKNSA